ncbi:hypothetical protein PI124_g2136 [Phytophthora idaei]|nr:hypothetical protein PI125_g1780 [Phytophthora idaei]KAG3172480.1 hypothetical protein PI126_g1302 [Phytophthora idaei]KAG3253247.1 hypothetical protein PI124_g2136 [Phytophthora idaei]
MTADAKGSTILGMTIEDGSPAADGQTQEKPTLTVANANAKDSIRAKASEKS